MEVREWKSPGGSKHTCLVPEAPMDACRKLGCFTCFLSACAQRECGGLFVSSQLAPYTSQVYNLYVASSHRLSSWIGVYELDLRLCITTRLSILLRVRSLRGGYRINSKTKCKRIAWKRALFRSIIINLNYGNMNQFENASQDKVIFNSHNVWYTHACAHTHAHAQRDVWSIYLCSTGFVCQASKHASSISRSHQHALKVLSRAVCIHSHCQAQCG